MWWWWWWLLLIQFKGIKEGKKEDKMATVVVNRSDNQ